MKQVPPEIEAGAPQGTEWFGGPVDRSKMTLRVNCKPEECARVTEQLAYSGEALVKRWRLAAPDSAGANLDEQVHWILSRLTADLAVWRRLASQHKIDLFCGLFLDRPNRGVTLSSQTIRQLADRGIAMGFDIYAPDSNSVE